MSKTDKELLELAAKAVDIETNKAGDGNKTYCYDRRDGVYKHWDPLSDDGDALRMAVDLGIGFIPDYEVGEVSTCYMIGRRGYNTSEEFSKDKHAATRRAIVRAAAAIGEAMQ